MAASEKLKCKFLPITFPVGGEFTSQYAWVAEVDKWWCPVLFYYVTYITFLHCEARENLAKRLDGYLLSARSAFSACSDLKSLFMASRMNEEHISRKIIN